jgi:hypothetical protein
MEDLTLEDVGQHISALMDSVSLINNKMQVENIDQETIDAITRNYQHIEIMLEKDFIVNSGEDLSIFTQTVLDAKNFINSNE